LVFKEFIKNVEQINYVGLHPERPKAAIILPYRYYDSSCTPIDVYIRSLFSAFVLAKQANIDVDFIKPSDPFDYDLLIAPAVPLKGYLTSMQWKKLVEFVSEGGSLYCSYNGVAFPELEDLFGIDIVSQAFPSEVEDFQLKSENVIINYRTTPDKVIDVEAQDERVIAWNKNNRPVVVKNYYNKGLTVFVTHPIEYYLSFMPGVAQSNKSYLFYKIAGGMIKNSIEYENQFVESKLFYKEDVKYLILANLENKASTFVINVDFDYTTIEDLTADKKILHGQDFSVELDSNGYKVYTIY
jgi:beta-galactosidase